MAHTFRCTVVTPQRQLLDEEVSYASIPAHDGQLGIMHQRAPLMVKLGCGVLRLDIASDQASKGGATRWFYVGGGFAQMKGNSLSLVTSEAIPSDEIVKGEAQTALKEALARVPHTDDEFESVQSGVARARGMLHLSSR